MPKRRYKRKTINNLPDIIVKLELRLGRKPTIGELAREANTSPSQILQSYRGRYANIGFIANRRNVWLSPLELDIMNAAESLNLKLKRRPKLAELSTATSIAQMDLIGHIENIEIKSGVSLRKGTLNQLLKDATFASVRKEREMQKKASRIEIYPKFLTNSKIDVGTRIKINESEYHVIRTIRELRQKHGTNPRPSDISEYLNKTIGMPNGTVKASLSRLRKKLLDKGLRPNF
jgi:DNA-directed RNA polymerase specialized sigma subunit